MDRQEDLDRSRRTYRVDFPLVTTFDGLHAWLRRLGAGLSAKPEKKAQPSLIFEIVSRDSEIVHYLSIPEEDAEHTIHHLHGLVPGINTTYVADRQLPERLTWADEFELTNPNVKLALDTDRSSRWVNILNSVSSHGVGESIVLQWCVRPVKHSDLPDARKPAFSLAHFRYFEKSKEEVARLQEKNAEPNFAASLRIGAHAHSSDRAFQLVGNTYKSVAGDRGFRPVKHTKPREMIDVISKARTPHYFTDRYTASELTTLIGWPLGESYINGLTRDAARNIAPTSRVLTKDSPIMRRVGGIAIGSSSIEGVDRSIAIDYESLTQHLFVSGSTGVGKTVMLSNVGRQVIEDGHGLIVIDPKGDLYQTMMQNIPPSRVNDVIDMNFTNGLYHVGFNIFEQGDRHNVIDELVDLFEYKYKDSGVNFRKLMYHGLMTLANRPGLTFNDLRPLLAPETPEEKVWALEVSREMKEPEFVQFWQEWWKNSHRADDARSTLNRIWQLTSRPETRYMLGQSKSSFQMLDVIRDNKILLVNLSELSSATQELIGTLLFNSVWSSARNVGARRSNFLMMDEFQLFADVPFGFDDVLALARKFNLCAVVACQYPDQLRDKGMRLQKAVLNNARSKIILNSEGDTARLWERFFSNGVKDSDISNLARYMAMTRLVTPSGMSQPFTMKTLAPEEPYDSRDLVAETSLRRYGRTVEAIRAEEAERRKPRHSSKVNDMDEALRIAARLRGEE